MLLQTYEQKVSKFARRARLLIRNYRRVLCMKASYTQILYVLSQMILTCLFFSAQQFERTVFFFTKGKTSDFEERTYHNINRFSDYIGAEIWEIFPCFHAVIGSDYTNTFSRRSKVQFFEQMVAAPSLTFLFSSMNSKKSLDIGGYKFVTGC